MGSGNGKKSDQGELKIQENDPKAGQEVIQPDPSPQPKKPRERKPMGRPSLINEPRVMEEIMVNMTILGMSESKAFEAAGCAPALPEAWRKRALKAQKRWSRLTDQEKRREQPYVDFLETRRKALIKFEQYHLANWANQAKTSWQGTKALLATVFPEKYANRYILRGDKDAPVKHDHEHAHRVMTQEEAAIRSAEVLEKSRRLLGVIDADQTAARAAEEALIEAIEGEDFEDATE
jgi:hypothetical protein